MIHFYSPTLLSDWLPYLESEFDKPYFKNIISFLEDEFKNKKVIYPATENIFNAFKQTSWKAVRVIILGQDPYHGLGQAHGLSFSVPSSIKIPPSLKNIFKEISFDLNCTTPTCGDLTPWAQQGVLLLNSVLTVESKRPGSHQNKGWEKFTDSVIQSLSQKKENLVFILWGAYAQSKSTLIDKSKHLILESPHPSPFSAYRGFFNSRPFSKANSYLINKNFKPINWEILCQK